MTTTVRRAGIADQAALLDLVRAFGVEEGRRYDEGHVLGALAPLLADDTVGQVWLADRADGSEPIGYAVLTWGWGLESGGREGLLDELFVAVPARGSGVGGVLLDRVVTEARRAACRTLFLETERRNERARALYARHGFAPEDSVWMRAELG